MYDSAEREKELSTDKRKTACITAAALLAISLLIITSSTINLDQSQAFAKEHSYESVNTVRRMQAVNETMESASPGLSNSNSGGKSNFE